MNNLIFKGVKRTEYFAPEIDVIIVAVEKGFAGSTDSADTDDDFDNGKF